MSKAFLIGRICYGRNHSKRNQEHMKTDINLDVMIASIYIFKYNTFKFTQLRIKVKYQFVVRIKKH